MVRPQCGGQGAHRGACCAAGLAALEPRDAGGRARPRGDLPAPARRSTSAIAPAGAPTARAAARGCAASRATATSVATGRRSCSGWLRTHGGLSARQPGARRRLRHRAPGPDADRRVLDPAAGGAYRRLRSRSRRRSPGAPRATRRTSASSTPTCATTSTTPTAPWPRPTTASRCDDGWATLVVATSVFTHLDRPAVEHYLAETRRALAPGGVALLTFFLLDDDSRAALAGGRARPALRRAGGRAGDRRPRRDHGGRRPRSRLDPRRAGAAGPRRRRVHDGSWRGGAGVSYQGPRRRARRRAERPPQRACRARTRRPTASQCSAMRWTA